MILALRWLDGLLVFKSQGLLEHTNKLMNQQDFDNIKADVKGITDQLSPIFKDLRNAIYDADVAKKYKVNTENRLGLMDMVRKSEKEYVNNKKLSALRQLDNLLTPKTKRLLGNKLMSQQDFDNIKAAVENTKDQLLPTWREHKDYYVSLSGNDNNDGSVEHPWRNINLAIWRAQAPATVYVKPGTYMYKPGADYYISMKDNVNLICTERRKCKIRGPIYPASNAILDGFTLLPLLKNIAGSTNEIFSGLSRFGSPTSHNILFPTKMDMYQKKIENLIVRNNYIYNGQFRIADSTNVTFINNKNEIDRTDAQYWGIRLFWGNRNITIKNNQLQSGRSLHKPPKHDRHRPGRPAGILIQNSENVLIENNNITVRSSKGGNTIGYGYIIMDAPGKTPKTNNITFSGNILRGSYIKELRDYTKEYCGNDICEKEELFNPTLDIKYSCKKDCCGDGKCTWPESVRKGKGSQFYCRVDCG